MKEIKETMERLKKKTIQQEPQQDFSINIDLLKIQEYSKIGIGKKFYSKDFDSFIVKTEIQKQAREKSIKFVEDYMHNSASGLIYIGKPGTGKTHLCYSVCKEIIEHEISKAEYPQDYSSRIRIYNITNLINDIKSTYTGKSTKSEYDIMNFCKSLNLLILDDLGKEYSKIDAFGNSWFNEKLYKIINDRYENEKPIIITTNFTILELENKIDPAIISRLIEMCDGIKCDWEDYRRLK